MEDTLRTQLIERFKRYTSIESQSSAASTTVPSTPGQWNMAKELVQELTKLGLVNIELSEFCVVTAKLPSNIATPVAKVGFCAHLDTVNVNLNPHINAQLIHYDGGDICLDPQDDIYIRLSEHPELDRYKGQDIFVSDGHSVLGADNKAAISSIMTALEYFISHPEVRHGDIYVAFVPDEEIGLVGSKHMDMAKFPVDFAYTLDSCELGEVVYETFNAGQGIIQIEGVSAHPMSAKGVLLNPTLVAVDIANCFNRLETPENTDGTDGYIWVQEIHSNQSTATVTLNIRDHHKDRYEAKKIYIIDAVEWMRKKYPRATITCTITDIYGNINDAITEDNKYCIDYIYQAMKELDITPKTIAMRGGTDGSFISTQGIPTPNFFTGAHNFHSYAEFLPIDSFVKSCQMILQINDLICRP
ncbi:peptidase T [Veillonella montpellierensis]|uniref:peptidase T n=1 Tax=Veillonella montpellierensis TaxID=187328 RepID=UPI0004192F25|nr:peptidase T [Veillonella montpellierensis]